MSSYAANNKRIAKNTLFLYLRMFVVLVVSLYTSRVILNTLGVEDYGVYSVVAGFVALFSFFNATLSASIQRFYNFEIGKGREDGVQNVYVSGLCIHFLIVAILLIVLETFGFWYVNNVMVYPPSRTLAVNVLFQCSILSLLLVVLQTPYVGAVMAYERMNFYALISVVDIFLKLAIAVALPYCGGDNLIIYGVLLVGITIIDFILYFTYAKFRFPAIRMKKSIDKGMFRNLLSYSGWNLVGTFAFLLKGQGVNLLLNYTFGPVINAARGIAFQVCSAINGFSGNIALAFRPQIVNSFAKEERDRVENLMMMESKICYVLILLLVLPVSFEVDYLLHLWLGSNIPEHTGIFVKLAMIDMLVCTLNTPCSQVAFAVGDIKRYQLVSTSINLLLIPASWCLLWLGCDASSVFIATIAFSVLNQIGCLFSLKRIFPFQWKDYLKRVLFPCLVATAVLPFPQFFVILSMPSSFSRFLVLLAIDIITALAVGYFLVLCRRERELVHAYIIQKLKKRDK